MLLAGALVPVVAVFVPSLALSVAILALLKASRRRPVIRRFISDRQMQLEEERGNIGRWKKVESEFAGKRKLRMGNPTGKLLYL
ncbi:hypothetical protein NDN08_007700 [Rhodosorus marinus]|uniref:Uncharacterized protein n=1 Tax=Rhodosorus marinus TaxID=101924 RepID=A0AAV8UYB5_9RHOD|nr:hypothetical protein NDN08_007700 [Rhodosorus marinus]